MRSMNIIENTITAVMKIFHDEKYGTPIAR